ncbi:MAG: GNAT family N-acetyltransferase [Spirochaetales bacterium]|nr:GNAT family N-acetyltransferase [Spirochaetales bacterium]
MEKDLVIRGYRPCDLPYLYEICTLTGLRGGDAGADYDDSRLLGHIFVGPYVEREPELTFTALVDGVPMGYILGTADSRAFDGYFRQRWKPDLAQLYPKKKTYKPAQKQLLGRKIWTTNSDLPDFCPKYPAHLHIDILPDAQGQGIGRSLMEQFTQALAALGVGGFHFGVDPLNSGALGFYHKLGLEQIGAYPGVIYFGKLLKPGS